MTKEEIVRNCEKQPDGKHQDPLCQMMFMIMNIRWKWKPIKSQEAKKETTTAAEPITEAE